MSEVALSRAYRWEPRREFLLRLDDREDVEDPVMYAHREFQEREDRAAKIRERLYSAACETLLQKMRYLSRRIGTARGEDRRGQAALLNRTTEAMEEARGELPEARQAVGKARERCADLEDEYSQIRQWQATNFDPVPIRRTSLPKLDDRQEVMRRFGTPPSSSALDITARAMGIADPVE